MRRSGDFFVADFWGRWRRLIEEVEHRRRRRVESGDRLQIRPQIAVLGEFHSLPAVEGKKAAILNEQAGGRTSVGR